MAPLAHPQRMCVQLLSSVQLHAVPAARSKLEQLQRHGEAAAGQQRTAEQAVRSCAAGTAVAEAEGDAELADPAGVEVPDRFRQIFYTETSERDYARWLERAAAAPLTVQRPVGELMVHATVSEPAVSRRLSQNFVCATVRKQYLAAAGAASKEDDPLLSTQEARLYAYIRDYCDVFHSACTDRHASTIERLTIMHGLNHALRAKQIFVRSNERHKQTNAASAENAEELDIRDSSLTTPKVLIVAPMRNVAYRCVKLLLALHGSSDLKAFHGKFTEEFGGDSDDTNIRRRAAHQPADFTERFRGNTDDTFMVS